MGPRQQTPPPLEFVPLELRDALRNTFEEPLHLHTDSLINLATVSDLAADCDDPVYIQSCQSDLVDLITEPVYEAADCYLTYDFVVEYFGAQNAFELFRLYGRFRLENGHEDPWQFYLPDNSDLVLFVRVAPLTLASPLPPAEDLAEVPGSLVLGLLCS
jgi:hypothetical protein